MAEAVILIRTLAENEVIISRGLLNFVETGRALQQIRDEKQYKDAGFKSFDDYLQSRWSMKRAHAYRFIEATVVTENVSHGRQNSPAPRTERVARAVAEESKDPDEQREIWDEAISETPEPTAADVHKAAEKVKGKRNPKPKDEPDTPVDHFKVHVSADFSQAFDTLGEFRSLLTAVATVKKDAGELAAGHGGKWIDHQDIERLCDELRRAIRFGMPYTECGRCRRDKSERKGCQSCKGRGWLCETAYKTQSAEDKAWIANRE